jgi:hypothetical protein
VKNKILFPFFKGPTLGRGQIGKPFGMIYWCNMTSRKMRLHISWEQSEPRAEAIDADRIQEAYLTNRYRDPEDTLKLVPTQADRERYRSIVLDRAVPNDEPISGS